jgi:hypothetical protein
MATQVSLNSGAVASAGALAIQTNGTTQAVSISTGQVATLAQNPILTSGTINGVAYLNGSNVLTTGSALTYDGTGLVTINGGSGANGVLRLIRTGGFPGDFSILAGGQSATTNFLLYDNTNSQNAYLYLGGASGYHAWYQNGTEALRLTSTSLYTASTINVGIGLSNPSVKLHASTSGAGIQEVEWLNNSQAVGADVGSAMVFTGTSSNNGLARISGAFAGATTADGAYMAFSTRTVTTGALTERMRLDSSGNLLVGDTSGVVGGERLSISSGSQRGAVLKNSSSGSELIGCWNSATTGDNGFAIFWTEASPSQRGSITYNRAGGLVMYNQTSDYRAKDISGPIIDSGALIDSVPVYMGKMKDATQERPMFLAHETPNYAHTGVKDAVDADGKPVYQQMDASALIPVMWAEIQSLRKRLATAGI